MIVDYDTGALACEYFSDESIDSCTAIIAEINNLCKL
ncbi:unnamed protein product [Paramecium primaurelia]|uniref:Uncharacterized protein n=1 Tax=Paramecium primaurelia TaxID=5886 RepID=A0A8S1QQ39_PARPR|nr:unnamed protein product [Paramecium primaurelia]